MGLFEHWPYTNFHDLNLNWIVQKLKGWDDMAEQVQQSAESAAQSATDAAESAESAAGSAESAAQSAADAAGSAESAADIVATVEDSLVSDGVKKIWAIQTNSNSDGSFYGLAASVDGFGFTLVDNYFNFLEVEGRNLGTDWQHFQKGDYHVFAITHKTATVDFYIAITKDFENWVHGPVNIGLSTASGFTDPYVWAPQIFEYRTRLYVAATVQEGEPVPEGDLYGTTLLRKSGIYAAEIDLDYETGAVTRRSDFINVQFDPIHDKTGAAHNVTGNAMDAWFVPKGTKLICVFNERLMQEIHTAAADFIDDTFTILKENVFNMPFVEAPAVLQINTNLWKVTACLWGRTFTADEQNLCCYTSDFSSFFNYGNMNRIDVSTASQIYTGRMRNPSLFYMTNEQEHNFCMNHVVHTEGYIHKFEKVTRRITAGVANILRLTDVEIQPNVELRAFADEVITLDEDYSSASLADVYVVKNGSVVMFNGFIGTIQLAAGANTIGTLAEGFRPSRTVHFTAMAGTGSQTGTLIRGEITPAGLITYYPPSAWSGPSSIRGTITYEQIL